MVPTIVFFFAHQFPHHANIKILTLLFEFINMGEEKTSSYTFLGDRSTFLILKISTLIRSIPQQNKR